MSLSINKYYQVSALETETLDYRMRIRANGGDISHNHLLAHDVFIKGAKLGGIWPTLDDVGTLAGTNLAAAAVKLKSHASIPLLTFNGGAPGYTANGGVVLSGNKWISTGYVPTARGRSYADISAGYYHANDMPAPGNYPMGDNPAAGGVRIVLSPSITSISDQGAAQYPGKALRGVSSNGTNAYAYNYGGRLGTNGAPAAATLDTEITLGKVTHYTSVLYSDFTAGCYYTGGYLTPRQNRVLSVLLLQLMVNLGRTPDQQDCIIIGDSNGQGQGLTVKNPALGFPGILANHLGMRCISLSLPSGRLLSENNGFLSGQERYQEIFDLNPAAVVLALVTNDFASGGDPTLNGDTAYCNRHAGAYTTMGAAARAWGLAKNRVFLCTSPWISTMTDAKRDMYYYSVAGAATEADAMFGDFLFPTLGAQYMVDEKHLSDAGHLSTGAELVTKSA